MDRPTQILVCADDIAIVNKYLLKDLFTTSEYGVRKMELDGSLMKLKVEDKVHESRCKIRTNSCGRAKHKDRKPYAWESSGVCISWLSGESDGDRTCKIKRE